MQELTKIELTSEEALLFIQFQKRYAFIKLMESINAFDTKDGSVTINFNRVGLILSIEKHQRFGV